MATQAASRSDHNNQDTQAIVLSMAERFGVDETKLLQTLKATAFRQSGDNEITDEQMYALLIVSNQYNLNPFTKEIFAFPDWKSGGIVPVVSVDGWNRIANENPLFDGVEFVYSQSVIQFEGATAPVHTWIEAVLYRKDRSHPIRIREYADECYRPPFVDQWGTLKPGAWQSHPKRMQRHKALIQCYRVGFGFVGIYDEDEAYRIINAESDFIERPKAKVVAIKPNNVASPTLEKIPAATVETVLEGSQAEPVQPQPESEPANESPEQTQPVDNQQNTLEPSEKEKMDEFLGKLLKRAIKNDQWQAAEELIKDRFSGASAQYALNVLSEKRKEVSAEQTNGKSDKSGSVETEQTAKPEDSSGNDATAQTDNIDQP